MADAFKKDAKKTLRKDTGRVCAETSWHEELLYFLGLAVSSKWEIDLEEFPLEDANKGGGPACAESSGTNSF